MAKSRVLIVEDEIAIAKMIAMNLRVAGYDINMFGDGRQAAEALEQEHGYDIALLDIMLPGMDGLELLPIVRQYAIPVIFLTARDDIGTKVQGLRDGAEDYIVKPFDVMELQARVEVVLRRYKKTEEHIRSGEIEVDTRSMRVTRHGQEIPLTRKEYDLLLLFLRNPNTALYRDTIYERVWGGELEYGSKTVDLHVQRLRKKLSLDRELQAIPKVGYRYEESV